MQFKLQRMRYSSMWFTCPTVFPPTLKKVWGFEHNRNVGLLVPPDSSNAIHRAALVELAERHRLPAVYYHRLFADNDGLASYGVDYADAARKATEYVDRILKGANAAELPVQGPTKFEFVINLKAAKRMGLIIAPILLARADAVIE